MPALSIEMPVIWRALYSLRAVVSCKARTPEVVSRPTHDPAPQVLRLQSSLPSAMQVVSPTLRFCRVGPSPCQNRAPLPNLHSSAPCGADIPVCALTIAAPCTCISDGGPATQPDAPFLPSLCAALPTTNSSSRNSSNLLPRLNFPESCNETKQFRTIEVLVRYHLTGRNYCAILRRVCSGPLSPKLRLRRYRFAPQPFQSFNNNI
jgi:hypothetical protein